MMKASLKLGGGVGFKVKGPAPQIQPIAQQMRDLLPQGPELPDESLPRALRTQREKPAESFKFRYKGAVER